MIRKLFVIVSIVSLLIIGSSCTREEQKTVETGSISALKIKQNLETFGVVRPVNVKNVTIDFPGMIESINVKEGQRVNKNDIIMTLNTDEFKYQIAGKEAELRIAKLELNNINKQQSSKSTAASIQKEKIKWIESALKLLNDRMAKTYLSGNNVISDMENGIVFEIGYLPGDILNPGRKVFSIASMDSMIIQADVPEDYIKDVKLDAKVEITPLKDKSRRYSGRVIRISEMAVQRNGDTVVPVEISIDSPDVFLSPNANVDLEIDI